MPRSALLSLIDKVLEFSRVGGVSAGTAFGSAAAARRASPGGAPAAEPSGPEAGRVRWGALVSEVADIVGPLARRNGVLLVFDVQPDMLRDEPCPLAADAVSIRQACVHLVENACRFTPAGGEATVTISLCSAAGGAPTGDDAPRASSDAITGDSDGQRSQQARQQGTAAAERGAGANPRSGRYEWLPDTVLTSDESLTSNSATSRRFTSDGTATDKEGGRQTPGGGSNTTIGGAARSLPPRARRCSRASSAVNAVGGGNHEPGRVWVQIVVADTGVGIPQSQWNTILRPFSQVLPTNNRMEVEGTGVGCAIVKLLIDKVGGRISFSSEEGVGTTFTVVVPVTRLPRSAANLPTQPSPPQQAVPASAALLPGGGGSPARSSSNPADQKSLWLGITGGSSGEETSSQRGRSSLPFRTAAAAGSGSPQQQAAPARLPPPDLSGSGPSRRPAARVSIGNPLVLPSGVRVVLAVQRQVLKVRKTQACTTINLSSHAALHCLASRRACMSLHLCRHADGANAHGLWPRDHSGLCGRPAGARQLWGGRRPPARRAAPGGGR